MDMTEIINGLHRRNNAGTHVFSYFNGAMNVLAVMGSPEDAGVLHCFYGRRDFCVRLVNYKVIHSLLTGIETEEYSHDFLSRAKEIMDKTVVDYDAEVLRHVGLHVKVERFDSYWEKIDMSTKEGEQVICLAAVIKAGIAKDDNDNGFMFVSDQDTQAMSTKMRKRIYRLCPICNLRSSLKCSRCEVHYCSREHQKEDWAKHKSICGKPIVTPIVKKYKPFE